MRFVYVGHDQHFFQCGNMQVCVFEDREGQPGFEVYPGTTGLEEPFRLDMEEAKKRIARWEREGDLIAALASAVEHHKDTAVLADLRREDRFAATR
jgi:hypothetical protein